ncbi:MAG TPA: T9SS C-terminal target domain-containing protein [Verrucomicrobiae bacterium]
MTADLVHAGPLKVDINRGDSKNTSGATASGYVPWSTSTDGSSTTSAGTSPITESFLIPSTGENVSISLAMTAAAQSAGGTGITYTYYSQVTTPGWQLASDGVTVAPQDNNQGGQIQMTITGLNPGAHTLLTYHNAGDAPSALGTLAPIKVYLNGDYVTSVTPSIRTNDLNTPTVYLNFTTASTNDVTTVLFAADTTSSATTKNVFLNGFEIDTPNVRYQANTPYPANGDEHANCDNSTVLMEWTPALTAVSNDVYVATDSNSVINATRASPAWKGTQTTTNYLLTGINSFASYYWRVDEIDSTNGVTQGNLWYFRPRHLAFPGAEGYGQYARGGRGGVVIEVTNLNDSGPGSYRAAISASGPRTIVFKVSGVIWLQSQCIVNNGYVTIAGQTAPGDGICLANYRAGLGGPNDVIMRFMHFRVGDHEQQSMDAMSPGSSTYSIFDHITSSWSLDVACNSLQSGSVGSQSAMTSYQHNIISEPLRYSYHYNDTERSETGCTNCYQPHAFAASISGEIGSYHHNLIAHSTDRNWSLAGGYDHTVHYAGSLDIRDNVVYNWNARTTDGGVARCNYENNYYKPFTGNSYPTWLLRLDPINTNAGNPYYYMAGNVMEGKDYQTNNWTIGLAIAVGNGTNNYASSNQVAQTFTNAEIFPSYVTTQSASNAYEVVLSDVGSDLPAQDLIDQRVIGEVLNGTTHYEGTNGPTYTINGVVQDDAGPDNPGFIDSQTDVHDYQSTNPALANYSANAPWPAYNTYNLADSLDSDHDGLPDWWELIRGTNPNSPPGDFSDANADLVGDGYTELERYLNWLAQPHYDCSTGATLNVDFTQYTRGFTNSSLGSTYAVFGATNGTIALNGSTGQFSPSISTNGLGSFIFTVTDKTGFSYTNSVNVHIIATPINTAPVLAPISDRAINVGYHLSITNTATDSDTPAQTLTYSLPIAPTNATIGSASGIFDWRPFVTQANTTNPVQIVVTDNGTPNMSATQNFNVIVNPLTLPDIVSPSIIGGQFSFSLNGQIGPDYAVQGSTNLIDWNTLLITNPISMPFDWTDPNIPSLRTEFYRIKIGPPLP